MRHINSARTGKTPTKTVQNNKDKPVHDLLFDVHASHSAADSRVMMASVEAEIWQAIMNLGSDL